MAWFTARAACCTYLLGVNARHSAAIQLHCTIRLPFEQMIWNRSSGCVLRKETAVLT